MKQTMLTPIENASVNSLKTVYGKAIKYSGFSRQAKSMGQSEDKFVKNATRAIDKNIIEQVRADHPEVTNLKQLYIVLRKGFTTLAKGLKR